MNSNYYFNEHLVNERIEACFREAQQRRLAQHCRVTTSVSNHKWAKLLLTYTRFVLKSRHIISASQRSIADAIVAATFRK